MTINHGTGLHARPASVFTKTAMQFKSDVRIVYQGKTINAKSIMYVLSAGITGDSEIMIETEGEDEAAAIETLANLVANNFQG